MPLSPAPPVRPSHSNSPTSQVRLLDGASTLTKSNLRHPIKWLSDTINLLILILLLLLTLLGCDLPFAVHKDFDGHWLSFGGHWNARLTSFVAADWDSWWTYEGISGPDFWGRLNPKWSHCSKGRRQSPINIDTDHIVFDPFLSALTIKGDEIEGVLANTGRSISLDVKQDKPILLSGGPLSYQYTLSNVTLHFGRENNRGSEHTINGVQFVGEMQLYAFNGQLYSNWTEAKRSPNGLAAIAAMIKLSKNSAINSQLKHITNSLKNITERGDTQEIRSLSMRELLPTTKQYVTYEGSLTQPACFETVQWIVLNKPIYMSSHQFHLLRTSLKGDGHQDNFRPIQELNHRTIRTNIMDHKVVNDFRFKYDLDHSKEENIDGQSFGPSKDLCYVNKPVAYKMNRKEVEIEIF